jgi:hypothetical protein
MRMPLRDEDARCVIQVLVNRCAAYYTNRLF